jgi:DNA-binding MarR family transcriptional regulator
MTKFSPAPRVSEQELRAFRAALRTLVRKIGRQLRSEEQCCGVGYLMSHVLLELEASDGCALKDLQASLGIDKAALSRSVDYLVKDGLVSRKPNPQDRRAVVLALTAAGRQRVAAINTATNRQYRHLFELIPAREHGTVICAVDYLAKAFDDLAGDSAYCPPPETKK